MADSTSTSRVTVPRDRENDFTREAARARADFVREQAGVEFEHVTSYSFDPRILTGNVEHFVGVAQVPIGLAGPLLVNCEHAQGEFYVPMATAEGTLVASNNRGMRLLHKAGGVTTTLVADHMQRAPAFPVRQRPRGADVQRLARRAVRRDQGGGRSNDTLGPLDRDRALLGGPDPLHAFQLHDR